MGAGRLPRRAGGKGAHQKSAGQWGTQIPDLALIAQGWEGAEVDALKPRMGLEAGKGVERTAKHSVRGVSKVSDLGVPGRRGWCRAGERKCGCLEGGMVGEREEGGPALEKTRRWMTPGVAMVECDSVGEEKGDGISSR